MLESNNKVADSVDPTPTVEEPRRKSISGIGSALTQAFQLPRPRFFENKVATSADASRHRSPPPIFTHSATCANKGSTSTVSSKSSDIYAETNDILPSKQSDSVTLLSAEFISALEFRPHHHRSITAIPDQRYEENSSGVLSPFPKSQLGPEYRSCPTLNRQAKVETPTIVIDGNETKALELGTSVTKAPENYDTVAVRIIEAGLHSRATSVDVHSSSSCKTKERNFTSLVNNDVHTF
jgi:hypothetical protein